MPTATVSGTMRDGSKLHCYTNLSHHRILDGLDEAGDLVAHGLGCHPGGGSLEVDMTCATHAGVDRVASGEEGGAEHCSEGFKWGQS